MTNREFSFLLVGIALTLSLLYIGLIQIIVRFKDTVETLSYNESVLLHQGSYAVLFLSLLCLGAAFVLAISTKLKDKK